MEKRFAVSHGTRLSTTANEVHRTQPGTNTSTHPKGGRSILKKVCKHPTCNGVCRRGKQKPKVVPIHVLKAKAQKVFNSYIRERDKDLGCISCGGRVDHAGHYINAGQHSALRFNELNVNGQCIGCNCYKHGNLIRYRQGLVEKIGETAVKELELLARSEPIKKWSRQEYEDLIQTYAHHKRSKEEDLLARDNNEKPTN